MKRIRSRLIIIMFSLVIGTSLASLAISAMVRNNILFRREDMPVLLFGFAMKDVLLIVLGIAAVVGVILLASGSTVNPVVQLNRATKEIASGNFDITVDIRDHIEEFGELERNFNRMAAELKTNEYLRKDFIANVSHELRTPIAILHGYAKLLEEGGLGEEEQREYAHYIAAESQRLTELIENMLRLSRMENSALSLRLGRFSLDEQLRQTVLRLEPAWSEKELEIDPELPEVEYCGDEELLGQVWGNLLHNAVKFTPRGGRIGVTLRREGEGVSVAVRDTGRGMSEAVQSRIFEQFYRGDTSHRGEGSGLGLPLARRIVELHGGSITVDSREGEGSCFTVHLPGDQTRKKVR